jgi:hypothetical protein
MDMKANMEANSERLGPAPRRGGRSWLKWGLLVHFLAIVIAPALLPGPAEATEIKLFFTEGVSPEDKDTARKALAETVKYFETNYQIQLNCNVRIVLTKGYQAFADALKRHCANTTKGRAEQMAKTLRGYSCEDKEGEKILIKVDSISKAELIIVVSHEIVHKFQFQESKRLNVDNINYYSYFNDIHWITEGVASAIGACVAESLGVGPVREARQIACLKTIRAKRKLISLTALHSKKEWLAAEEKYGSGYQYTVADLAVYELAKLKGYKSLFQYFRYLKRYNNAQAFEMTFGMKLSDYEKYFDQLFAEKMLPEPEKIRLTRTKDGAISDNATGLEWYAGPDKDTNWFQAQSWTESLTAAGGGWRMPTVPELKGLYQKGAAPNNMDPIFQTTGHWVWSGQMVDASSAWGFNFLPGTECYPGLDHASKGRAFAVRSRR